MMKQYMNSHFDFCMDRKPMMTWNRNKNLFYFLSWRPSWISDRQELTFQRAIQGT
jgi:hypothetical protein